MRPTEQLETCPDCGGALSETAEACPHCGRVTPWPLWLIGAFVVGFVGALIGWMGWGWAGLKLGLVLGAWTGVLAGGPLVLGYQDSPRFQRLVKRVLDKVAPVVEETQR